jgi:hypothetical protein
MDPIATSLNFLFGQAKGIAIKEVVKNWDNQEISRLQANCQRTLQDIKANKKISVKRHKDTVDTWRNLMDLVGKYNSPSSKDMREAHSTLNIIESYKNVASAKDCKQCEGYGWINYWCDLCEGTGAGYGDEFSNCRKCGGSGGRTSICQTCSDPYG